MVFPATSEISSKLSPTSLTCEVRISLLVLNWLLSSSVIFLFFRMVKGLKLKFACKNMDTYAAFASCLDHLFFTVLLLDDMVITILSFSGFRRAFSFVPCSGFSFKMNSAKLSSRYFCKARCNGRAPN